MDKFTQSAVVRQMNVQPIELLKIPPMSEV